MELQRALRPNLARIGRGEQARHMARCWAGGYPAYWLNYGFAYMACNRHMAPLLLQGMLAEPLGADPAHGCIGRHAATEGLMVTPFQV